MKKLIKLVIAIAGVVGLISYMDKHGLPVIGNITMHLPFGGVFEKPFVWMMDGIHFLESKGIEGL